MEKEIEIKLSKRSKLPYKQRVGAYEVISSIHAQARAAQRRNDLDQNKWKTFFRKITNKLESDKIKKGTFMFHDKSDNISSVVSINRKILSVVTVYPKGSGGRLSVKQQELGQERIVIESVEQFYEFNNISDYIQELSEMGIELDDVILV